MITQAELPPVLVVAYDPDLAEAIRREFQSVGIAVTIARPGYEVADALSVGRSLAVAVDRAGYAAISQSQFEAIHAGDWTPLVVFGALDLVEERINFIRAGADDCLSAPFDVRELVVRVEALVRRRVRNRMTSVLQVGEIEMDLLRRSVRCAGRSVELLPREFALLEYFVRHPLEVLSSRKLLEELGPRSPISRETSSMCTSETCAAN